VARGSRARHTHSGEHVLLSQCPSTCTIASLHTDFFSFLCAGSSVQGTLFKSETTSKEMIKFAGALSKETVVDIKGKVLKAEVGYSQ